MTTDRVAIVTGASSGIGACCAARFARAGFRVYGLQRTDRVPEGVTPVRMDITDSASVSAAFAEVLSREGRIDVLVNNAGFGISGAIEFTPEEEYRRQIDVNVFGMVRATQQALPVMRQQRSGTIVSISSVAGVLSIPFQAFYSASKSSINALTLALTNEVRPFGINVCALMPGDVKTGFTDARRKEAAGSAIYTGLAKSVSGMERDEQNGMRPEVLAERVFRLATARSPKPLSSCGASYRLFCVLQKLLPVRFINFLVGKLYS